MFSRKKQMLYKNHYKALSSMSWCQWDRIVVFVLICHINFTYFVYKFMLPVQGLGNFVPHIPISSRWMLHSADMDELIICLWPSLMQRTGLCAAICYVAHCLTYRSHSTTFVKVISILVMQTHHFGNDILETQGWSYQLLCLINRT